MSTGTGAPSSALVNRPSARLQRAANRSIEDCACKATSARLMWVGGHLYGWWVTLHVLDSAIVHASAAYQGGGHWVAGQGMLPESNRRHGLMLAEGA